VVTGQVDFTSTLNAAQYEAVTYNEGPLLIIAGAGSGKTRTLVHRVAWLIKSGVMPQDILLLTFTRKAAREMLERVFELTGGASQRVDGGTFHSVCNVLLRSSAHVLGYESNFTIMDPSDATSLITTIRKDIYGSDQKGFPKSQGILNVISMSSNLEEPIPQVLKSHFPHLQTFAPELTRIALIYADEKKSRNLMDFDDLLVNFAKILQEHEDYRLKYAKRYKYLLVDEYQDTNPVQARITYLLAKDHMNVTAVGDEAQSIYAFRGATFKNIMNFPYIFRGTKVLTLEENYRSITPILDLANGLLVHAKEKYEKNLKAVREGGVLPVFHVCSDVAVEADVVTDTINELINKNVPLKDIAVLFRNASHSYELEISLIKARIPFTKYGGLKFTETSHNKDFMAFLRAASNPSDEISFKRLLLMFPGIGSKGADSIVSWVDGKRENLISLSPELFRSKDPKMVQGFIELFSQIAADDDNMAGKVKPILDYYLPLLPALYPDDHTTRKIDVEELAMNAQRANSLSAYLAELTLDPPSTRDQLDAAKKSAEDLTLSTIHSAKGLEWKYVFVLSLVDGRFPSPYTKDNNVEEERRLLYVALTRAKDELHLMFPKCVETYSSILDKPTRFLHELPYGSMEVRRGGRTLEYSSIFRNVKKPKSTKSPHTSPSEGSSGSIILKDDEDGHHFMAHVGQKPLEHLEKGQMVEHQTFGRGCVIKVQGQKAVINFDAFGRKTVNYAYGHLYPTD
jgi:DNA helicase-2/ATP-dependent DNA helicase PcrA